MSEYRCPICKRPARPGEEVFPFCSSRCKLIDLGAWVDDRYRITRSLRPDEVDPEVDGEPLPSPDGTEGAE
jgi:endogenous inhibitor of DNA gyrase (YacG/DUF329 family)